MATRTVTSADFIRPYKGPLRTRTYKEEASQTFKRGHVCDVDATAKNEVEIHAADGTTNVLGVAAEPASGVTDTLIQVYLAEPGVEFIGVIEDAATVVVGNLGTAYGLVADATNLIHRVDTSDTTNTSVIVTELIDLGDVNGRVAFQFLDSARAIYRG